MRTFSAVTLTSAMAGRTSWLKAAGARPTKTTKTASSREGLAAVGKDIVILYRQMAPAIAKNIRFCVFTFLMVTGWSGAALTHEFWISPSRYVVEPRGQIVANLRIGKNFEGSVNSYIPSDFSRFEILLAGSKQPVKGRLGDIPALTMQADHEGLAVVVHETTPTELTYPKWEKFEGFANQKDLGWVLKAHKARGLPKTDFKETYRRFAKSLIAVGSGRGQDTPVGMETEIVAEANPYTDDITNGLPIRILYKGEPRIDAQVEVFSKSADKSVKVTVLRTDAEGRAIVPVKPKTEYLLDAVVMRTLETDDATKKPAWGSLWASITFKTGDTIKP